MAVGLVLVSISVLIFAFLFFSTLSGFGLKQIMNLTILKYQAPTWQVALGYVFKVFLALFFLLWWFNFDIVANLDLSKILEIH